MALAEKAFVLPIVDQVYSQQLSVYYNYNIFTKFNFNINANMCETFIINKIAVQSFFFKN